MDTIIPKPREDALVEDVLLVVVDLGKTLGHPRITTTIQEDQIALGCERDIPSIQPISAYLLSLFKAYYTFILSVLALLIMISHSHKSYRFGFNLFPKLIFCYLFFFIIKSIGFCYPQSTCSSCLVDLSSYGFIFTHCIVVNVPFLFISQLSILS